MYLLYLLLNCFHLKNVHMQKKKEKESVVIYS